MNFKKFDTGNIYLVLAYRIMLVLLLFTICRVGFYLFNFRMFPGVDSFQFLRILQGGFVFDISAIVYINLLFILLHLLPFDFRYNEQYQKALGYLFFITNGLAIAANTMDFVYYRFIGKRATAEVFQTFSHEQNVLKISARFIIDYWQASLLTAMLWVLMVYLYRKLKTRMPGNTRSVARAALGVIMIPVIMALVIGAARGGYRHSTRPITISNATKYVENPANVAVVLNTPFSIFRTFGSKTLQKVNYFDEDKLTQLYDPHYSPSPSEPFLPHNVVIIILESFAREYIGSLNPEIDGGRYEGYTPFIDSLLKSSLTFDVSIANGRKSIDAMPSILASIPSLETPYIISHYANNRINALPLLLKDKGYHSAFFHGAPNGSMGFDSFARLSGFDQYYGLNEYPHKRDFDGMWGVWDEPFLMFFAEKLSTFKQPFLGTVFTLSSHHPFEVPEHYRGKFKKGPVPICEVVGYTDNALRKFFRKVSAEPWFENTLFVITADHTNELTRPEHNNNFGSYSIPIIFFKPGSDMRGVSNRIAQQIDIMPSILSYLNFDEEYFAFGNDLFDYSTESFAFNSNGSNFHLYMRDHLLEMLGNSTVGLHNYKEDVFLVNNLAGKEPELRMMMEDKLRAIIQTYNNRLIDNRTTIPRKIASYENKTSFP
jgi:phosphoglycerol transferase MdoB-like AlkP superfamily enzyme